MGRVFEQVPNVEDLREANIKVVGDRRMPVLGEMNERAISREDVREGVKEINRMRHQVCMDLHWSVLRNMVWQC